MKCWNCGDKNPKHYRFCGNCGEPAYKGAQKVGASVTNESHSRPVASFVERVMAGRQIPDDFLQQISDQIPDSHSFSVIHLDTSDEIIYRDASGRTHTYSSSDEMPADIRALYDVARRSIGDQPGVIIEDAPAAKFVPQASPAPAPPAPRPVARPQRNGLYKAYRERRSRKSHTARNAIYVAITVWLVWKIFLD